MKRSVAFSLVLLCMLFVAGCPYSSKVPLAEPGSAGVDDRLLGHWAAVDSDGDSLRITVFPFNQREYYAEVHEQAGDPTRFRFFTFDVRGERFLHLDELSPAGRSREYLLARYSFSGESQMSVRFVGERIVPESLATDAGGLRAFLEAHLSDPGLDDEDTELALRRREQ